MTTTTILSDNGVSSGSAGIKTTGGNDGTLQLQTTTSGGTATTAVTIDTSQNVGIGTSSPVASTRLHVHESASTVSRIRLTNSTTTDASGKGLGIFQNGLDTFFTNNEAGAEVFSTSGTERMRIDSSGNLLVGTTSVLGGASGKLALYTSDLTATNGVIVKNGAANTAGAFARFVNSSDATIGTISQNASTTVAYNTSSDYRLKHDIQPMTGALAKVQQLKPCTYKWNADDSEGEGFIAHELAEVCPHAVTGAKDAINENGTPNYQGIDTSFLVATLTAAIQELNAKIIALENKQ